MTTQHQAPEVTSEDREAAADLYQTVHAPDENPQDIRIADSIRKGNNDHWSWVKAFAAHRTRATQPLSLTVDEIMTIARLRELLAKCPALPIAARPQEHDDWGVIRSLSRNEEGYQPVFARAYSGRYETDIELNAHRRAKTDPTQDTMDLIVEGLNALPALLDRLQSISGAAPKHGEVGK